PRASVDAEGRFDGRGGGGSRGGRRDASSRACACLRLVSLACARRPLSSLGAIGGRRLSARERLRGGSPELQMASARLGKAIWDPQMAAGRLGKAIWDPQMALGRLGKAI